MPTDFARKKRDAEQSRIRGLTPMEAAKEYIAHVKRRDSFKGATPIEIDFIDVTRQDERYRKASECNDAYLFLWASRPTRKGLGWMLTGK